MNPNGKPFRVEEWTPVKVCLECQRFVPLADFRTTEGAKGLMFRSYCKPCDSARSSAWAAAHPEQARAADARAHRRWRATHRDTAAEQGARRRARILGVPIEPVDRTAIYERDRGICHICRRKAPREGFTLDHLIPLFAGGAHTAANLAVAHRSCNSKRGTGRIPAQLRLVG